MKPEEVVVGSSKIPVPSNIAVDNALLDKEAEKPVKDQLRALRADLEKLYAICRNLKNRLQGLETLASEAETE